MTIKRVDTVIWRKKRVLGEEQVHCKLCLIVPESDLVVIRQDRLKQSPAITKQWNI